MKLVFATLLIASMVLSSSFLQTTIAQAPAPAPAYRTPSYNCSSKCTDRCAAAGYKKRCMNYCKICCDECKCVPSGTVGNKSECPCYRDKLNSKGKSKCP